MITPKQNSLSILIIKNRKLDKMLLRFYLLETFIYEFVNYKPLSLKPFTIRTTSVPLFKLQQ